MSRIRPIQSLAGWGIAIFLLTACDRTPPQPDPEPSVQTKPDQPASAETAATPDEEENPPLSPDFPKTKLGEIPTSEDLEREAENTVALQNLEAELDRLEAEIVESPN